MNDDDKVFRYNETRNASRVRERDENSERMLWKTNYKTEKNNNSSLIDDEASMTRRELIKIIHKIISNKAFEINKIINRTLRQLADIIVK